MARSQREDFIQGFRFHARTADFTALGYDPLSVNRIGSSGVDSEAGFQQITIPETSAEASEYREGIYKWTRKLPGPPTLSDTTFMRGVVRGDTGFYDWMIQTATGGDYRVDIDVFQYARGDIDAGVEEHISAIPSRTYKLIDAFPIRVKPAGDLDSSTGDVSIAEMDVASEKVILVSEL